MPALNKKILNVGVEMSKYKEKNVAFIPVRGGSKSIPLKNIKKICGRPLVYWTVEAACRCEHIDKVYVATDSEEIRKAVWEMSGESVFSKIEVIGRSPETATDTASTESAMLEFARNYIFENIVLIQATSPLLTREDLDKGFEAYNREDTDSVLSVVRQKRFQWKADEEGLAEPVNYDYRKRPRRQEFDGYLVENGAFYITSRERLLNSENRLSGRIRAVEMDEKSYFEIDEPEDFVIIENLMKGKNGSGKKKGTVKMFLTDCDGCLTDGGMYYSENGDELKKFNTRDGMGFQLLREKGILTGIVTGEDRKLNRNRAEKLKLDILEMGVKDKASKIRELCDRYGVSPEEVAYVGDDLNDIGALELVGFPCCVNDAADEVKEAAAYISEKNGGEGAIREIINQILRKE